MNTVQLVGNLGRDNEVKFSQSGTAYLSQSLGVRRSFKDKQTGEYETDWVNLVFFGKTAENFANFTKKGSKVGIEGRLQSRNYENQQGQRVYVTEVVVSVFHLLEPRQGGQQQGQGNYQQNNYNAQNNQFRPNNNQQSPYMQDVHSVDIPEDDLPFENSPVK